MNGFIEFRAEEVEQSIPARFDKQVQRYPDKTAVKTSKHELTYDELNHFANCIAKAILSFCNRRRTPIILLLEQGIELIATILGILKADNIYVPLDPSYPQARLAAILEDAKPAIILTNYQYLSLANILALNGEKVINLSTLNTDISAENLGIVPSSDSSAYIFYTSGSTGTPKGVVDNHRNVLHNIMRYTNSLRICASDRLTLLQSCSFSGSVSSLFCALLNGATIFPYNLREEGIESLPDWLVENEITIYHSVPSVFRHVAIAGKQFPKLRLIRLEGDQASSQDVELYKHYFSSDCLLVNGLGATECGIVRQYFIDKETDVSPGIVPIGHAVKDMEILIRANAHVSSQFGSSLAALCQHLHKILVIPPCFETLSVSPTLGRFLLCQ